MSMPTPKHPWRPRLSWSFRVVAPTRKVAALALAYSTLRTATLTPEPSAKSGPAVVPTEAPASAAARPTVNAELTEPLKPTPSASAPSPSPSPSPSPTAVRAPTRPSAEPSTGSGSVLRCL